ncbi:DNA mismatch repair endonuclease MutL [Maribacter cobaltidurans]|uniref:DNA mismatch repair protein MutL n=1 Tax=Maribacter cobaltidurans TaxID=1178778 RepID=A0A223V0M9_9FLAO|nr:DNA mismatch repair endonuclease MutL [Maribacter cobaltidurans]ASV28901.1 DNA mismatch repair protein MutL [Maribacter cobaltidurans]GGD73848.1 DNA mismatch repair protein MutL [Maribacter cobaltidurans]
MADIIRLLPDHVANQIAAGEVVQRPASVVKELLENAIDAQSTDIKLIVKDGGKTLIQVVDNGIGMSDTDARLSFERHATSKIQKAEDLFNLHTKGFRGEALASIAAIAHVEMMTRTEDEEVGTHIKIEGSKIISQEVAVVPKGTSMMVKNLFFNIPARRNFLKSDQVEFRHITDEFHRVALAHPQISFSFYNNGSDVFNLPGNDFKKRIVQIFGRKTNEKLVPINEDTNVVRISGYIQKPEFAKKSRGEQFFFANNRFIKSPYLHHAVLGAFEGLIKPGTHPGYFICLEVDPATIDINIHPTKTEVKFDDEHTLYAYLKSTIKHSLGQFNVAPSLDFEKDQNLETPYNFKDKAVSMPGISVDADFNPFQKSRTAKAVGYSKQPNAQGWENMYQGLERKVPNRESSILEMESEGFNSSIFDGTETQDTVTTTFQLRKKYIVSTIKSGMLIINQSRAHQRVLYEGFLKNITIKEAVSQQLLFPLTLNFTHGEISILREIKESLCAVGFVFGDITHETVEIKGVPVVVTESEVQMVMEQLISDFQMEALEDSFSQVDMLAKTLSKTLSVKTGEILDERSQLGLVNDLFACKESALSPFNKRTYITLTENDIDRKFI